MRRFTCVHACSSPLIAGDPATVTVVASFDDGHVGHEYVLDRERIRFGRSNTCAYNEIVLYEDTHMNRGHGRFERRADGRWWVVDLGTSNGIFINGARVEHACPLASGDRILAGRVELRFTLPAAPAPG